MRYVTLTENIDGNVYDVIAIRVYENGEYSVTRIDYEEEYSEELPVTAVTVTAIPVYADGEPVPFVVDDEGDNTGVFGWRQPDGSFYTTDQVLNGFRFVFSMNESDGKIKNYYAADDSADDDSADDDWDIINLTPHPITIVDDDGVVATIPASGMVARALETSEKITGYPFPVYRKKYGEVQNLPEPSPGKFYIVSALTAQAVPERADVIIVNDTVRDESGQIIGCRSFAHI